MMVFGFDCFIIIGVLFEMVLDESFLWVVVMIGCKVLGMGVSVLFGNV